MVKMVWLTGIKPGAIFMELFEINSFSDPGQPWAAHLIQNDLRGGKATKSRLRRVH